MISCLLRMWRYHWYAKLFTLLLPVCQLSITASTYLTLAMAVERYTTVCHPFFKVGKQFPSIHIEGRLRLKDLKQWSLSQTVTTVLFTPTTILTLLRCFSAPRTPTLPPLPCDNINFNWFQVNHQFKARSHYIFPILLFSLLYNFPKFFELTVGENKHFMDLSHG